MATSLRLLGDNHPRESVGADHEPGKQYCPQKLRAELRRVALTFAEFFAALGSAMYHPFFTSMMLALEAQKVIELRLVRLAWGGHEGAAEMQSMVVEKLQASMEAANTLMWGGSPEAVIARYREHVATNTKRLSAA